MNLIDSFVEKKKQKPFKKQTKGETTHYKVKRYKNTLSFDSFVVVVLVICD